MVLISCKFLRNMKDAIQKQLGDNVKLRSASNMVKRLTKGNLHFSQKSKKIEPILKVSLCEMLTLWEVCDVVHVCEPKWNAIVTGHVTNTFDKYLCRHTKLNWISLNRLSYNSKTRQLVKMDRMNVFCINIFSNLTNHLSECEHPKRH